MEILFVSEQFPWPTDNGGNLRTFHILKLLAARHQVTLLAHAPRSGTQSALDALAPFCHRIVLAPRSSRLRQFLANSLSRIPFYQPIWLLKNESPRLRTELSQLLDDQDYDLIHLNMLDTACFQELNSTQSRKVFDTHNCLSDLAAQFARTSPNPVKRWILQRESKLLRNTERDIVDRFDVTLVCSEADRKRFHQLAAQDDGVTLPRIEVIPNGISQKRLKSRHQKIDDRHRSIVFVGAMDYLPNVDGVTWFCRNVWPKLAEAFPELHFVIVGRNPTTQVRRLQSDRIRVTGFVDDTQPFLDEADLVVVPLRNGSGTRLKILEAMAAGKPVVSTTIGAAGLELIHDTHLLVADTVNAFAESVSRLLGDPVLARRLTERAAHEVERRFTWKSIGDRLISTYASLWSDDRAAAKGSHAR